MLGQYSNPSQTELSQDFTILLKAQRDMAAVLNKNHDHIQIFYELTETLLQDEAPQALLNEYVNHAQELHKICQVTPFHFVCALNRVDALSYLLKRMSETQLKSFKDVPYVHPLMLAISCGHAEVVKALLSSGLFNVNSKMYLTNGSKRLPLEHALLVKNEAIIQLLLDSQANVTEAMMSIKEQLIELNPVLQGAQDVPPYQPLEKVEKGTLHEQIKRGMQGLLMESIAKGKIETVESMIDSGVDAHQEYQHGLIDDLNKSSPLMYAVLHSQLEIIKLLVQRGANVFELGSQTKNDCLTVAFFLKEVDWDIVEYVLSVGEHADKKANTISIQAVLSCFLEYRSFEEFERFCSFPQVMRVIEKEINKRTLGEESFIAILISNDFDEHFCFLARKLYPKLMNITIQQDEFQLNTMMYAARKGSERVLKAHVENDWLSIKDIVPIKMGAFATPLSAVIGDMNEALALYLIENGALSDNKNLTKELGPSSMFVMACRLGLNKVMSSLIESCDLSEKGFDKEEGWITPLQACLIFDRFQPLDELLEKGYSLQPATTEGDLSDLALASGHSSLDCLRRCIQQCSISTLDMNELHDMLLHSCVNKKDNYQYLLDILEKENVDISSTVFALTAYLNQPSILLGQIQLRGMPYYQDSDRSALKYAIENGSTSCLKILLENGVDTKVTFTVKTNVGSMKVSPFIFAICQRNSEAVELLKRYTSDEELVCPDNHSELTHIKSSINAAYFAAIYQMPEVIDYCCVERGCSLFPSLTPSGYEGFAPLLTAIFNNDVACIDKILLHGAKQLNECMTKIGGNIKESYLETAYVSRNLESFECLLRHRFYKLSDFNEVLKLILESSDINALEILLKNSRHRKIPKKAFLSSDSGSLGPSAFYILNAREPSVQMMQQLVESYGHHPITSGKYKGKSLVMISYLNQKTELTPYLLKNTNPPISDIKEILYILARIPNRTEISKEDLLCTVREVVGCAHRQHFRIDFAELIHLSHNDDLREYFQSMADAQNGQVKKATTKTNNKKNLTRKAKGNKTPISPAEQSLKAFISRWQSFASRCDNKLKQLDELQKAFSDELFQLCQGLPSVWGETLEQVVHDMHQQVQEVLLQTQMMSDNKSKICHIDATQEQKDEALAQWALLLTALDDCSSALKEQQLDFKGTVERALDDLELEKKLQDKELEIERQRLEAIKLHEEAKQRIEKSIHVYQSQINDTIDQTQWLIAELEHCDITVDYGHARPLVDIRDRRDTLLLSAQIDVDLETLEKNEILWHKLSQSALATYHAVDIDYQNALKNSDNQLDTIKETLSNSEVEKNKLVKQHRSLLKRYDLSPNVDDFKSERDELLNRFTSVTVHINELIDKYMSLSAASELVTKRVLVVECDQHVETLSDVLNQWRELYRRMNRDAQERYAFNSTPKPVLFGKKEVDYLTFGALFSNLELAFGNLMSNEETHHHICINHLKLKATLSQFIRDLKDKSFGVHYQGLEELLNALNLNIREFQTEDVQTFKTISYHLSQFCYKETTMDALMKDLKDLKTTSLLSDKDMNHNSLAQMYTQRQQELLAVVHEGEHCPKSVLGWALCQMIALIEDNSYLATSFGSKALKDMNQLKADLEKGASFEKSTLHLQAEGLLAKLPAKLTFNCQGSNKSKPCKVSP